MEDGRLDMGIKKLSRRTVSDSSWQMGGPMKNSGEGQALLNPTLPTDTGSWGTRGSVLGKVQELLREQTKEPEDI